MISYCSLPTRLPQHNVGTCPELDQLLSMLESIHIDSAPELQRCVPCYATLIELQALIGLPKLKASIVRFVQMITQEMRSPAELYNVCLLGDPGTGKSTVLKLLCKLYCDLQLLSGTRTSVTNDTKQSHAAGAYAPPMCLGHATSPQVPIQYVSTLSLPISVQLSSVSTPTTALRKRKRAPRMLAKGNSSSSSEEDEEEQHDEEHKDEDEEEEEDAVAVVPRRRGAPTLVGGSDRYFVQGTRSNMIGGVLGQTTLLTQACIDESIARRVPLMIDEAYMFGHSDQKDMYGKESIDCLCLNLTKSQGNDFICMVAGYSDSMNSCFFAINEGLADRFPKRFVMDPYSPQELQAIFYKQLKQAGFELQSPVSLEQKEWWTHHKHEFPSNGRNIDSLLTNLKEAHAARVFGNPNPEIKCKLNQQDFEVGWKDYLAQSHALKHKQDMPDAVQAMYA